MTAKKYLEQIQLLDIKINQDCERLERMRAAASGVSAMRYDKDIVQTSPAGDRLCLDVVRIVELDEQIDAEIDSYVDGKNQIIEEIRGLGVPMYVEVLYKRYVEYKTIFQIADELHKKDRTIKYIHKNALIAFEKKYNLDQIF